MNNCLEISNSNLIFNNKKVLTEGDIVGLPLGALVPSTVVQDNTSGLILADGSTYSQSGILSEFTAWLKLKYPNGDYTNEEYENDLLQYGGQCGHYVIDDINGTIRFPRIIEFVASNNAGQELGSAELDSFKSHNHTMETAGLHGHALAGNKASGQTHINFQNYLNTGNSNESNYNWWASTTFDGNHTHTINSSGKEETKPKNIRYPFYIVVAAGVETDVKIDINNYLADLTNLSSQLTNITSSLKSKVLWENANYSSDFSAQTIDIGEPISNFEYIEVYLKTGCTKIKTYENMSKIRLIDVAAQYYNTICSRDVTFSDSKIIFADANKYNVDGIKNNCQPETKVNNFCKPMFIIGYKEI